MSVPLAELVPPTGLGAPDEVLARLWQLCRHDLPAVTGSLPDAAGLFRPGRLPSYFEDEDRGGYLLRSGASPVGFALLSGLQGERVAMGDFFVVRAARRGGLGRAAVHGLWRRHPGPWTIAFQTANTGAGAFWRRVADEGSTAGWTEEHRPVPGKPELPWDVWLELTV